jgi:hypothetical protein
VPCGGHDRGDQLILWGDRAEILIEVAGNWGGVEKRRGTTGAHRWVRCLELSGTSFAAPLGCSGTC